MSQIIKVKKANFYHIIDNKFLGSIDQINGYGIIIKQSNKLVTGFIVDPSGFQDAVYYKTGILTGKIVGNNGSYTWTNLELFGTGEQNRVFANYITGYKAASNTIEFINSTGSGLQEGDIINIANFIFTYKQSPTNISEFNSPLNLINILNSGASGGFNDQGFISLQNSVGVTGYLQDKYIKLFSLLRSGDNGNNIIIYKNTQNLYSIKIHSRYFTGGLTFRPIINNWIGDFSNTFNLTVENSGFYVKNIEPTQTFGFVSGVSWINNFSGNYNILTGFKNPISPQSYSGIPLQFNNQINKYSGSAIIPKNESTIYTGLNIEIFKSNPYNISGNIVKYTFSGDNFIFQDNIEG